MDLVRHRTNLQRLIKTYFPDFNIPEDPEERKKMGVPEKYWFDHVDLTEEQVKERNKTMYGPISNSHDKMNPNENPQFEGFDMDLQEMQDKLNEIRTAVEKTDDKGSIAGNDNLNDA
jgi:hypothetical protein